MLEELSIRNFAIIDDIQIGFGNGLTILSGETGAGKSIIVNAVNLLLGGRASAKMVRTGCETAEVQALFRIDPAGKVADLIDELGFKGPEENCLLVRRLVARNNRHRIYINDRLATVQVMARLTGNLASISGQHAHQGLLKEDNHLLLLDKFAGLLPLRGKVAELYREIIPLEQQHRTLLDAKHRQAEQLELLAFQQKEIQQADIQVGEDLQLEHQRDRLKNLQNLFSGMHRCLEILYSGRGAVLEQLTEVAKELNSGSRIDPALEPLVDTMADTVYRVEDLSSELRSYLAGLETDDSQLEEVEARLDLINRLKRKYGGSIEKVIEHGRAIADQLEAVANLDNEIEEVERELDRLHRLLCEHCRKLSSARKNACEDFACRVMDELAQLQMKGTLFKVLLEKTESGPDISRYCVCQGAPVNESGCDKAVFMIAPNVGEEIKPLAAIASGGELSRVVLAIKVMLAGTEDVETLIFDEVDAGIGGQAAEMVGRKLASLAGHHQVLCITHLPQIAKFGSRHFKIDKQVKQGRTVTTIELLSERQRIEEIARMIAGRKITSTTLAHAREMLENL